MGLFDKILGISSKKQEDQWEISHWLEVGMKAGAQNRWQEAVICYDKALAIDATDPAIWKCKAAALLCLHNFNDASICIKKSLSINPQDSEAKQLKHYIDDKVYV